MTTQYTPSLRLALPGTGELDGQWGEVVNNQITELVEQALTGHVTINTWTANQHTLTSTDGVVDEARAAVIVAETGSGSTGSTFIITAPAASKLYVVVNNTGNNLSITSSASGANVLTIPNGQTAFVACDGQDFRYAVNYAEDMYTAGTSVIDGVITQSFTLLSPSSSINLDANVSNFYSMPVTGGGTVYVSLSETTAPALTGNVSFVALLINPGAGSISWPGTVRWPNNTAPIINSSTYNLFLFTKFSSSSYWYGAVLNNYV